MKFSLKLQDDQPTSPNQFLKNNPILKAKIPITVLNQPLISTITTTTTTTTVDSAATDLSLSFSTNFPSGPSLKLSYSPTASSSSAPFSVSLKSGLGLFGSPRRSPLIFSANLSLSPSNPNPVPSFSLHFKPSLGDFSLRKATLSNPNPNPNPPPDLITGFVPDSPSVWEDVKLDPKPQSLLSNSGFGSIDWKGGGRGGFLSGVAVTARTALPLMKGLVVNLRWGVNLPADLGMKMPYLTVNKIGIERIEEVKNKKNKDVESKEGDLELLKGMCFWMKSDLEALERENREMKRYLEEMKMGVSSRSVKNGDVGARKKVVLPPVENSSDQFEQWRSKKIVPEESSVRKEPKKAVVNKASDLENELQRAIKAAA